MNMRKIMAGLAVTTLVLGSASLALARGHHGGHYGGMMNGYAGNCGASCYTGGYQNLTPEKRAAVDKLIREHAAATNPLREQLQARRLELDALSRNPNAQPESISRLAGEVAKLSSSFAAPERSSATRWPRKRASRPCPAPWAAAAA